MHPDRRDQVNTLALEGLAMKQIRVCVVGYGNVGREAVECVRQAPDMELRL